MADYSPYVPMFQAAGQKWDIDPALLQAVARQEAGIDDQGRPQTSRAGAQGIMQFMPTTAKEYGVNPNDPTSSIMGAAHKMSDLLQYYGGDIPSALASYNGSTWDKGQTYAKGVLGYYNDIQKEEAAASKSDSQQPQPQQPASASQSGLTISEAEAKQPPQRNLSPQEQGPNYFEKSTQPGARTETPIVDAGTDYGKTLYGASSPPPPAQAPEAPGKPAPAAQAPDYGQTLYGAPPAPSAAPSGAAPAAASLLQPDTSTVGDIVTAPPAPGTPTGNLQAGGGADLPSKSPYEPPTFAPTPETWLGRNVTAPIAAMYHPDQLQPANNYLLGTPALQSFWSGITQASRDYAQTLNKFGDWVDANVPALGAVDRYFGQAPGTVGTNLPAETAAYNQQYGGSWGAAAGRLTGQLAGGYGLGVTKGAGLLARGTEAALPDIGRYVAPIVAGGFGGGAQNALVSGGYGEDPWRAAGEGALGGAVLGGTIGNVGNYLTRGSTVLPRVQIARDLGIPLSQGDIGGKDSFIKGFEDTTKPLPFSGEAQKVASQQQAITRLLTREMGEPEQDALLPPDMVRIRTNIGDRIDQATANMEVPSSPRLMTDLSQVENAARQSGPDSPQWHNFVAIRDQLLNQMANNTANPGTMSGPQFQRFLAQGGTLDNALNSSNLDVQQAARGVRDALFNAAAANPNTSPGAIRALQTARYQWKVEEAVRDSIERQASGTEGMTFPKLAGSIARGNFYPGSPMSNLSQLLYDIPSIASSGTAERLWRQRLFLGAGDAGETGLLWALNNPHSFEQALFNIVAPVAGNVVAGRASRFGANLGSPTLQAAQQVFNPLLPRTYGANLGNMLLGPQLQTQPQ